MARPVTTRHDGKQSLASDEPVIPPDFELFFVQPTHSGAVGTEKEWTVPGRSVRATKLPDAPEYTNVPPLKP